MRKMRLYKREIHDPALIKAILDECDIVRLGLHDEEGMFIVPVNYGYELKDNNGKADAIMADPHAAIEMDCRHEIITGDYTCSYSYAYRSIMGNGTIILLESEEEKRYALGKLMEHMAPEAEIEFSQEMLERTAVYRVEVEYFTGKERRKK